MNEVISQLASRDNRAPGDYVENGVRMCAVCKEPKQTWMDIPGVGKRLVSIACNCERAKDAAARQERAAREFDRRMVESWRRYNIMDMSFRSMTFAADDQRNPKISDVCRRYVENWPDMLSNNVGILFYGTIGTGKSYMAYAIVNALLSQQVPAAVTSFPRLLNLLQGTGDRQTVIDDLQRYKLLVIDDLAVERGSAYATEQVFNVIDARARSKLPLVITSNLTMDELKEPGSLQYKRIYDRVLEMCAITLKMTGESRRAGNGQRRADIAREILFHK